MATKKISKDKTSTSVKTPIAVVISDLHMSLKFLEPASKALENAIEYANSLKVPLICAGDFHDTKAIHRSECIRASRELLKNAAIKPILLVGNHDRENEKADAHALDCYADLAKIVNHIHEMNLGGTSVTFIPYCHDREHFDLNVRNSASDTQLIVHQGIAGAKMGEYVADRSQVDPSVFDRFTKPVYSGHYHEKQTVGNFTYFGTPFTTSFSEAKDGPKGFHILMSDGTIELVETNLRKHIVVECSVDELLRMETIDPNHLLWLKVSDTAANLARIKKADIGAKILGHSNFKLDKIKTDNAEVADVKVSKSQTFEQIMSGMITNDFQRRVWEKLNEAA